MAANSRPKGTSPIISNKTIPSIGVKKEIGLGTANKRQPSNIVGIAIMMHKMLTVISFARNNEAGQIG